MRAHPCGGLRPLGGGAARALLRGPDRLRRPVALVGRAPRPVLGRRRHVDRRAARRPRRPGADRPEMPGAVWFPGTTVNYAEQALRQRDRRASPALIVVAEDTEPGRGLLGDAARPGRRVRRDAAPARRPARRPRGRLPAQRARRRSSPSSGRRPSARSGPPARPTSAPAPSSTGSPRSSRPCWSPSTATGSTARSYDRRDVVAELRAGPAHRADDGRRPPAVPDRGARRRAGVGGGGRRRAGAGVRAAAVRPPAVDRLLVRARPGCRRGSCTGTAAWCWSSTSRRRCTWTSAPATGSSGTPRPPGSCGTSRRRRCSRAPRSVRLRRRAGVPVGRRPVRPRRAAPA